MQSDEGRGSDLSGETHSVAERRAYVGVISRESRGNYAVCRRESLWGFTINGARRAREIRPGDLLWFYLGGIGFAALAEVTSHSLPVPKQSDVPWKDGRVYSATLPLRFLAELEVPIYPSFPKRGGYKFDAALGISTNHLMSGFFRLTLTQHELLVALAGGAIPPEYARVEDH